MNVIVFGICLLAWVTPRVAHAEGSGTAASGTAWDSSKSTPDDHEETPHRPKSKPEPRRRWYGYMTLLADGLSVALIAGGAATDSESTVQVGAVSFILASPIIHLAHGQPVPGVAGPPVRALGLLGGGVLGFSASQCELLDQSDTCDPDSNHARDRGCGPRFGHP